MEQKLLEDYLRRGQNCRADRSKSSEDPSDCYCLQKKEKVEGLVFRKLGCFLSLGVEGYVESVGSPYVEDALDCSCSSNPR